MSSPVAAIDCGTNSTRLLIHDGERALERAAVITRLGAGVDATGRLAPDAIDRTVRVLTEFRSSLEGHGVDRVLLAATSAARDATNAADLFAAAGEAVGTDLDVLSGTEEAGMSFRGATLGLDPDSGPFAVLDIGGGSTEFAVGADRLEAAMSLDIGCVRMTERYLLSDPPLPEELRACLDVTELYLDDVARELPTVGGARRLVGVAGTITTAAAVELGLEEYDRDAVHHFVLSKEAAEDVFRTLATESHADRLHNPGLEEARADVIVAGMCILVAVMRGFGFDECLVSETDLLDGMILHLLDG